MAKLSRFNRFARVLARVCGTIFYRDFNYPQPIKGTYNVAGDLHQKLKWAYKLWIKQLEVAERGRGIEDHFAGQDLRFPLPPGFNQECSVSLSAGGDLMAVDVLTPENTRRLFDDIADYYFNADIVCANLETPVYSKAPFGRFQPPAKAPVMNTNEAMVDLFLNGGKGINFFSTANNHSYDQGEAGLLETLDLLEGKNCRFAGTNRTAEQQEDVLILEENGIKIAMLVYTFDLNGHQYEKKHLINEVRFNDEHPDLSMVQRHIELAQKKGADIIIAHCHWGWEYEMYPHKSVMEVAKTLVDMGVDVILGGHPHVSQPMERLATTRNGRPKDALVVYSLGDFVSYHPFSKNCKVTFIPKFRIVKGSLNGSPHTCITDLEVLPVYIMAAELPDGSHDCRLLRLQTVLDDTEGRLPLTPKQRGDVPRLYNHVWRNLIMPKAGVEGSTLKTKNGGQI